MDIKVVDFQSADAPRVFTDSLKETGFAVLTNHPVEDALIHEVYDEWREFLKYLHEQVEAKQATVQASLSDAEETDAEKSTQPGSGSDADTSDTEKSDAHKATADEKEAASSGDECQKDRKAPVTQESEKKDGESEEKKASSTMEEESLPASMSTADAPPAETLKIDLPVSSADASSGNASSESGCPTTSGIEEPMFSRETFRKAEFASAGGSADVLPDQNAADKYLFNPQTQDGYFPLKIAETAKGATVKDMKQYFHLYFPNGRYPEEVSRRAQVLGEKMLALGKTLVKWIDDNMSDEIRAKLPPHMQKDAGGLSEWVSNEQTLLRILHYPSYREGDEEPGAVRAAAHEDINVITVLPAGSTRGLQVRPKDSETWYEVPCIRGSLVINIGDMLQEATGGEYISTTHRVVKPEEESGDGEARSGEGKVIEDRMAVPCFIHFKPETYVSEKYPTAKLFLEERLRELGVLK